MKRGNNGKEKWRGTRTHINIDHWGLHDCFYNHKEQVYKKSSTRHTNSQETIRTIRKELKNIRTLCACDSHTAEA